MIIASPAVIAKWRQEAADAFTAASRPIDPALFDALAAAPREVIELVAALSEALARASGALGGSADLAIPGATAALEQGLDRLAREVYAVQAADRAAEQAGDEGYVCPLPTLDGQPFRCGCPLADRCDPALAYACGLDPATAALDSLDADLERVVETDRAVRGDDGCEGGPR